MNSRLDRMPEWQSLESHAREVRDRRISALFEEDKARFHSFSANGAGLLLDYSKQNIDSRGRELLLSLAEASDIATWRDRLFRGDTINITEDRAVLHTALRAAYGKAREVTPADALEFAEQVRDRMKQFVEAIHDGRWRGYTGKPIKTVVNIGIGGSDLGPAMVCRALTPWGCNAPDVRFVSNIDPQHLQTALMDANPESTLFVLASKTFTTAETMANASAARHWLLKAMDNELAVERHFVAVTSSPERAMAFGVAGKNIFPMADWIGGRFSLWSAIGIPIALHAGMCGFEGLLRGAARMDDHFLEADLDDNLPVLMAMVGIWNRNFRGSRSLAVVPYAQSLELFPAYLQQLEMESNGKRTTRQGEEVRWDTCPVIWGAPGTNGQHAFFQQLHQGTGEEPVDFLLARQGIPGHDSSRRKLQANAIAQSAALMEGRAEDEVRSRLEKTGMSSAEIELQASHRRYPGNRPSSTIVMGDLSPQSLGALIALYEHKVFVQGIIWQICSFDQWGVELGKELAGGIDALLAGEDGAETHWDASTRGLVQILRDEGEH